MKGVIQVAGVLDEGEARLLAACGVDHIGFPLRLAAHAQELTEDDAARIIRSLDAPTRAVLITYLDEAEEIAALCDKLSVSIVQIHGDVGVGQVRRLKEIDPALKIIKSVVIGSSAQLEHFQLVERMSPHVDAFITDTLDPATGARGATGKTHDWRISRRIVEASPRPVILAGGLNADNVGRAIARVGPAGVDAHTGLEDAQGRKRRDAVRAFVNQARTAFASIENNS